MPFDWDVWESVQTEPTAEEMYRDMYRDMLCSIRQQLITQKLTPEQKQLLTELHGIASRAIGSQVKLPAMG